MQRTMGFVFFMIAACGFAHASLDAQQPGARQQYGPWQLNKEKGYHYRKFEYKVNATDKEYKHEYVIYFKEDPKNQINNSWVYFYNPTTEKFWARYPTTNHPQYGKDAKVGKELWSVLPAKVRNKDIYQIGQKQFPTPRTDYCPTVPMCTDNCNLISPPSDLP